MMTTASTDTACPTVSVPAPPPRPHFARALRSRIAFVGRIPDILKRRREVAAILDARADLGYELLAGRVDLSSLKPAEAELYLQGLDVIESRDLRLLEIYALRAERGKRCPWRLSPLERSCRKQPNTPAGRRQRDWLNLLEEAGLLGFRS